ncbi:hypothetical protein AB0451_02935 [Streptomyces sp. NPDC052000]|uniref:hypothetical protein n=1 Tax=Streptomyces sp. NPDC052000 TaxID=3155676 RepID=UPI00344B95B2
MTDSRETTPAREELHSCTYCDKMGADCCIRLAGMASGTPRPVFAHAACASDRGIKPLYYVTDQPTTVVVSPWA